MGWVATDPSTNPFFPVQMPLFVQAYHIYSTTCKLHWP